MNLSVEIVQKKDMRISRTMPVSSVLQVFAWDPLATWSLFSTTQ